MEREKHHSIPKPLNVGVRHGDEDVVPSRGPLDGIIFLQRKKNILQDEWHTNCSFIHDEIGTEHIIHIIYEHTTRPNRYTNRNSCRVFLWEFVPSHSESTDVEREDLANDLCEYTPNVLNGVYWQSSVGASHVYSTPNSFRHVFIDLAICTGTNSCWNQSGPFLNSWCCVNMLGSALAQPFMKFGVLPQMWRSRYKLWIHHYRNRQGPPLVCLLHR